eukprot:UN02307
MPSNISRYIGILHNPFEDTLFLSFFNFKKTLL